MKTPKFKRRSKQPFIWAVAASIGLFGAVGLAIYETPKAVELLKEAKQTNYGREIKPSEKVKLLFPIYIPVVATTLFTLGAIFAGYGVSRKMYAGLASAYGVLAKNYRDYQSKVKDVCGEEVHINILREIAKDHCDICPSPEETVGFDDVVTFYDELSNRYFQSTKLAVRNAEYHLNRNFILKGYATLNEFYEFIGIDKVEGGDNIGWTADAGAEFYGYQFIDFEHEDVVLEDGMECCILSCVFPPTADEFYD